MKWLLIVGGIFLFIGIANLPIGYYTFLRIIVTIIAVIIMIAERSNGLSFWNIVLLMIAVLFNPFILIYLHEKETWKIIDLICGALFMIKASTYGKSISI
ncbi:MAG: hypothetical protein JXR31_14130 [Prolixibacteraceae bacterium]|nr:hypothetical protein [Prolixibacteraceae bacterium]